MSLLPFFEWMQNLPVSVVLQQSVWLGAALNMVHLLSMVTFAGAVLIVDLRLLGRGLTDEPLARVARDAQPWLLGGFAGLVVTGVPALMYTATMQYESPIFWRKMEILLLAVLFTFTVRRKVTLADEARVAPFWAKVVGLVSIVLWAGVAASARLIMLV